MMMCEMVFSPRSVKNRPRRPLVSPLALVLARVRANDRVRAARHHARGVRASTSDDASNGSDSRSISLESTDERKSIPHCSTSRASRVATRSTDARDACPTHRPRARRATPSCARQTSIDPWAAPRIRRRRPLDVASFGRRRRRRSAEEPLAGSPPDRGRAPAGRERERPQRARRPSSGARPPARSSAETRRKHFFDRLAGPATSSSPVPTSFNRTQPSEDVENGSAEPLAPLHRRWRSPPPPTPSRRRMPRPRTTPSLRQPPSRPASTRSRSRRAPARTALTKMCHRFSKKNNVCI